MDRKKVMDAELLFLTFKHFDYDNDGFINVQDLRLAIGNAGDSATQQEVEEMIADWDLDNNRLIDFEEFKKMMADSEA
jgi:calmodulin